MSASDTRLAIPAFRTLPSVLATLPKGGTSGPTIVPFPFHSIPLLTSWLLSNLFRRLPPLSSLAAPVHLFALH